jgi:cell division septation protein DedD
MWQGVMLYWSLTGGVDLKCMRGLLVSYLKWMAFSIAALGLSACARMHMPDPALLAGEPKVGEPPEAGAMTYQPQAQTIEADRIEKLEAQVAALGADVANIRKALEVIGPLPDPGAGSVQASFQSAARPAAMPHLYAPAPAMSEASRSLFYEAELGSFRSKQAAEACWRRLAGEASMVDLNPRFTLMGAETMLSVGPVLSEAAVNALKVEISAISGPCQGWAPIRAH